MPKFIRKNLKGTEYVHITIHGIAQEFIFEKEREKQEFKKLMLENQKHFNINIIAYCFMNNHIHLLINFKKVEDLSNYMHKINTSYAIYYNKNHQRNGYVYKGRFYSQVIIDENYFRNCIVYIHNNPVKAKICIDASKYYFSSYYDFLKKDREDEMKKIFGSREEYEEKHKMIEINQNFEKLTKSEINQIIEKYLKDKKITKEELKLKKEISIELLTKLKLSYNVLYRQLEELIGIGRESIRRMITK